MILPVYVNGKFAAQRTTGVQRVAREILCALDDQVAAVGWTLLCPPSADPPPLRRIAVRRLGPPSWPLHAWEQLVLPWAARDGVLINLAGAVPAAARRQLALLHDAAVFDHPEAYSPAFRVWYRCLFRHLARRGDTLMTVSEFSRLRLAEALAVPASRLGRLRPGSEHLQHVVADERVLDIHGLRDSTFVLAVGSANPTKNLDALVEAWRLPGFAAQRLVIAGGAQARVFAASERNDVPGLLRLGPVDDAALVALYRHARVLVFPSVYEGFGLPPLEAMGQGCPVLAARAGAIPEVCGDAVLYLDDVSPASIREGLQRILADATLRAHLREAGRTQAGHYRWELAAADLLRALQQSLGH